MSLMNGWPSLLNSLMCLTNGWQSCWMGWCFQQTGDQALSVRFPVEGHVLHCDLLSSILKYEVSTWLKNKVHQWLLPLTSKCISVFLLECSDFWGSKILGGRGESKGKSKICRRPLTWVWTTFWTVKNLHRSAIHIYIMGPAWKQRFFHTIVNMRFS